MKRGDVGVDYSGLRPDPAQLVKDGAKFILRYSAGAGNADPATQWKLCGPGEINAALAAGLDFVANCEWYESRITEGADAGAADGAADLDFWQTRGLNKGASIYVSWDANPDPAKWPLVDAYLTAYNKALAGHYRVDCYAGTPYLKHAKAKGLIRYGWRPNAGAWSGDGLPYQPANHGIDNITDALAATPAHIWQTGNYWYSKNADENVILRSPVGSHRDAAAVPPKPKGHDVDLSNKSDVAALTAIITDTVLAVLQSDAGKAAIHAAHPFPDFNLAADGNRHSLGSFLYRIQGGTYKPFTPPPAAGSSK